MPFIQIHTLKDYSVSLPNRGADGLAKRAIYGGVERQRISSQSIKAAMRNRSSHMVRTAKTGELIDDTLPSLASALGLGMSVRSAIIGERRIAPALIDRGFNDEEAEEWSKALMHLWRAKDAKDTQDNVPLVVGEQECDALVGAAVAMRDQQINSDEIRDLFDKPSKLKKSPENVQNAVAAVDAVISHAGVDGALFGRFATGVAVNNVDSCVHVAHALTVHPLAAVADFFISQDELKSGQDEERGGSHIDTTELTAGLFYNYAVVDLDQMATNFADISIDRRAALAAWVVRAFAQAEPAAKLGSTAPYSGLRECLVEVGQRQPRSLMGAFEMPIAAIGGKTVSEVAREAMVAHLEDSDMLVGRQAWRGWLREYASDGIPAIEGLAAAAAEQLVHASAKDAP